MMQAILIFISRMLLCFVSLGALAQSHPALNSFSANVNEASVILNWSISGGNTCNGVSIERAAENSNFEEVGHIPGVCGNAEFDVPYQFTDDHINKTGVYRYRLQLGQLGYTEPVRVFYYNFENRDFVYSTSQTAPAFLLFNIPDSEEFLFSIYTSTGNLVYSQNYRGKISLQLPPELSSGIYIISAISKSKKISGRIFVAR